MLCNRQSISRKEILLSVRVIAFLVFGGGIFVGGSPFAEAYFKDTSRSSANVLHSGVWVPTLSLSVSASTPSNANQSWCVSLTASSVTVGSVAVYYKFSEDGNPLQGGTLYSGTCVSVPTTSTVHLEAQAVNTANSLWKSAVVGRDFAVGGASVVSGPIVLNEFVPDTGDDSAALPNGEWIELYNTSGSDVSVAGWYMTHTGKAGDWLPITGANTNTGNTLIKAHGWLVVYRNGSSSFSLDNTADTLQLWEDVAGPDVLRDAYAYGPNAGGAVVTGKSFARFPDGGAVWIDPEVTAGNENMLKPEEVKRLQDSTNKICFTSKGKLRKNAKDVLCDREFLVFIGMLHDVKSKRKASPEEQTAAMMSGTMTTPVALEASKLAPEDLAEVATPPAKTMEGEIGQESVGAGIATDDAHASLPERRDTKPSEAVMLPAPQSEAPEKALSESKDATKDAHDEEEKSKPSDDSLHADVSDAVAPVTF